MKVANYEMGKVTVTRMRYKLKTPSNAVQLDKMISAAAKELGRCGARISDDALTVTVEDDTIVVWWEVESDG